MKKIIRYTIYFLPITIFFQGCFFNERGISSNYYNTCSHYYDSMGLYREKCDDNIIDYKDINPLKNNGKGIYYTNF